MPSKSPAQARLMAAAAHTPGGYGGVPQKVGRDFNKADTGTGVIKPAGKPGRPKSKTFDGRHTGHRSKGSTGY